MFNTEILKEKKAILFDLDGTLIDSMWVWKSIDIEYLASVNEELPDDLQKNIEGMSFLETAIYFKEHFNIDNSAEEIVDIWNKMAFYKYSNEVRLKEGVIEFLKFLKANNFKIALATSNSRILTYEVLKKKGIYEYLDAILTGDDCLKGKPSPDVFLKAAEAVDISPEDCIVFEDLIAGIKAGINANMTTVAINDDYSAYQWEEKKELADYYIENYTEILNEIYNT